MVNCILRAVRPPSAVWPRAGVGAGITSSFVRLASTSSTPSSSSSSSPPRRWPPARETLHRTWSNAYLPKPDDTAHDKLIHGGFLHPTHAGIFQLLPLGLRVQDKITALIDGHMRRVGASRVQLSTLTPEELWEKSGRLDKVGSELFRLSDRKGTNYLLSPTHEEAITSLVASHVKFETQLPLRLYQITQKYRDELRPRQGLLRTRDFLMKDLYTFDYDLESALKTYEEVRAAYSRIFVDDLKLPMIIAQASSGDMGGDLSHEYHIPTELGEDHVMSCDTCHYAANEEVFEGHSKPSQSEQPNSDKPSNLHFLTGVSKDRTTIVNIWYRSSVEPSKARHQDDINLHAVKKVFPDLDSGISNVDIERLFHKNRQNPPPISQVVNLFDKTVPAEEQDDIMADDKAVPRALRRGSGSSLPSITADGYKDHNFLRAHQGDPCPRCSHGTLNVTRAIELGHTFHLGTRYSEPLKALVNKRQNDMATAPVIGGDENLEINNQPRLGRGSKNNKVAMQMGCHGIGISRIMGAVANHVATPTSLAWPRAIAPYEVVFVTRPDKHDNESSPAEAMEGLYDQLVAQGVDAVLDGHRTRSNNIKACFAFYDLIGIPVWLVLGKEYLNEQRVEVRCPRLGVNDTVHVDQLAEYVKGLLDQL